MSIPTLIRWIELDRLASTARGTPSSERDDDGSNIMPIFSDGILLYVLDAKSRESTSVNIFQAKGSIMSTYLHKEKASDANCPRSKWISVRTERGDYYYYHRETRETTWDTPIGFSPLHDETSASQNESKTTTTSKTTATQSRQNFGFEFLRCIKLSWVIKDSDSIPEGNLHKFCLKSSFFTNGMRLHALCGKKLLCWSLKKGVVKMAEDTFRQVVPGEAISFSEILPNCKWNSPQCQVTKEDGHTNGHSVPVCFDRVNNCLWSVDISAKTRISCRWANLHPTQQWFGGLVPQEDDPSIMLHEFTKNRSRSSFKMTNNLGSALILAGLDSLQSPLRPPTYGALENSEYLISLNAPSLVSTTPETLEAFGKSFGKQC